MTACARAHSVDTDRHPQPMPILSPPRRTAAVTARLILTDAHFLLTLGVLLLGIALLCGLH